MQAFEYEGYGPYESYVDKHRASSYGTYQSTAKKEYFHWIKPQETGSHYASTRLTLANGLTITADKAFSFSVLPYSTQQIKSAAHDFELPISDGVYVNIDAAMSGIGTASCGSELQEKYRAPKTGNITFRLKFEDTV
jgi:beta-galactosidase